VVAAAARERIRRALADLEAERKAAEQAEQAEAEAFRARQRAGQRTGLSPASAAVELAGENLQRVRAARAAQLAERYATGQPRRGRAARPDAAGVDDYCRVRQARAKLEAARVRAAEAERRAAEREENRKGPGPVRNITDPDSRLMPVRGGGFIQGYNTQNMTSEDELVIATELTGDPTDMAWSAPMPGQAQEAAALIGAHRRAAGPGRDDGSAGQAGGQDTDGDQDWGGPAVQAMRARLKTPDGIAACRQRGHIAETPHGHIKHNMGLRQLSVRGKAKADAEWTFACAVCNLFKAITTGHLTPQALTAPASWPGPPDSQAPGPSGTGASTLPRTRRQN
jgi:hypothetical protein